MLRETTGAERHRLEAAAVSEERRLYRPLPPRKTSVYRLSLLPHANDFRPLPGRTRTSSDTTAAIAAVVLQTAATSTTATADRYRPISAVEAE